jgi:hypothetical protein
LDCLALRIQPLDAILGATSESDRAQAAGAIQIAQSGVAYFQPRRVILFGSMARGEAGPDSDNDLLVVLDDDTEGKTDLPRRHGGPSFLQGCGGRYALP